MHSVLFAENDGRPSSEYRPQETAQLAGHRYYRFVRQLAALDKFQYASTTRAPALSPNTPAGVSPDGIQVRGLAGVALAPRAPPEIR